MRAAGGGAAPPVSVLLPVRDAEATLGAALESVLAQTCGDFELLGVDDGSRDASAALLAEAAARDRRVVALETAPGARGIVAALERGRAAARGRWLLRMDADDLAHPRRLERCLGLAESDPALVAVSCLVRSFPEALLAPGRRRYDAWLNGLRRHEDIARERFVECPLAHPSVLLSARAVAEAGGYRQHEGPEDYDLFLRLLARGGRMAKVDRVLHFWREGQGRLQRTDPRYQGEGLARVRAAALAEHLGGRPAAIVGAGTAGRRLCRGLLAAGARVSCFLEVDPRKLGRAPHGVPVLAHGPGLRARGDALVAVCVNAWGARARVRDLLRGEGLVEGPDFLLAG